MRLRRLCSADICGVDDGWTVLRVAEGLGFGQSIGGFGLGQVGVLHRGEGGMFEPHVDFWDFCVILVESHGYARVGLGPCFVLDPSKQRFAALAKNVKTKCT